MREQAVILETVHGSRAYGLATAESDTDRKGVFVAGEITGIGGSAVALEAVRLRSSMACSDMRRPVRVATFSMGYNY